MIILNKLKLSAILTASIFLFSFSICAQKEYLGRDFESIKQDYQSARAVARVKVTSVQFAFSDFLEVYKVESRLLEVYKGKLTGKTFVYYFDAEKGYDTKAMIGTEREVFLKGQYKLPTGGGKGWVEIESSALPVSDSLNARLRKLKSRSSR